jgi:predicted ABC-type ATPase
MNAVLKSLTEGERFPFSFLLAHTEDCFAFWDWWWSQVSLDALERPCLIQDEDPILQSTHGSLFVDSLTHYDYFGKFLRTALKDQLLPMGDQVSRSDFQDALIQFLYRRGATASERRIIFAGGGYGAGKTTILSSPLSQKLVGSLAGSNIVGVDYFKLYLPEYEVIRRLGDGRASTVVQGESRLLADRLFDRLIQSGRSFIWDSSMSDGVATMLKIQAALARGYQLDLVAVVSPLQAAIRRAMHRAKDSRRFAHPEFLPKSHEDFQRNFHTYFPHFQRVMVYWNNWSANPGEKSDPLLVGEKDANNELVSYDDDKLELLSGSQP